MLNSQMAMPVSPTTELEVVQDFSGQPVLFSIGNDGSFNAFTRTHGADQLGWKTTSLVDSFQDYKTATAFDVSQDASGLISTAFALQKANSTQFDVFIASKLDPDLTKTDLTKLSTYATKVEGIDPEFAVETIVLGTSDDEQRPLTLIVGKLGESRFFYQLQATNSKATPLEFPENVSSDDKTLLSVTMGYSFGQRANFFLYKIGESKSLIAKTIADATGSLTYDYSPGNSDLPPQFQSLDYNTIATPTSRPGADFASSDLFIGASTGVYRIVHGKAKEMEAVTTDIKDVHQIIAVYGSSDVSLWVGSSPSDVHYIYGKRESDEKSITWNSPVLFTKDVLKLAAIRSTVKNANELFVLDQDSSITHHWQDPSSKLWRKETAKVKDKAVVLNFNSYTTLVNLKSGDVPLSNKTVRITSSEWQYCMINGLMYSLDINSAAEVPIDIQGNVTIISQAHDLSPPIFHIQSDQFAETLNIYPTGKIHTHLQSFTDGKSLENATTQDGKPVLAKGTSSDLADTVAGYVTSLVGVTSVQYPPTAQGHVFTAIESHKTILLNGQGLEAAAEKGTQGVKHTHDRPLDVSRIPKDFFIGMVSENGKWRKLQPKNVDGTARAFTAKSIWDEILDDVSDAAGDVWNWLETSVSDIVDFVEDGIAVLKDGISFILEQVEDGLSFVLKLADKALRIILKTVGHIFKAICWVLKLVGIDVSKILGWLGHLLGWDHVWATHKMIVNLTNTFMDFASGEAIKYIEIARGKVKDWFSDLDTTVKNAVLPSDLVGGVYTQAKAKTDSNNNIQLNSPANQYSFHHLLNGLPSTDSPAAKSRTAVAGDSDPLSQFFTDIIEPMSQTLFDKIGMDVDALTEFFKDPTADQLKTFVVDIADTVISFLTTLIDGVFKFFEDLTKDLKAPMNEVLDIPIIGALWDFLTNLFGEQEDFTILNCLSLALSLPVTTISKMVNGPTIDEWGQTADGPGLSQQLVDEIQRLNQASESKSMKADNVDEAVKSARASFFVSPAWAKDLSHREGILGVAVSFLATLCELAGKSANPLTSSRISQVGQGLTIIKAAFTFPIPKDGQPWFSYLLRILWWCTDSILSFIRNEPGIKQEIDKIRAFKLLIGVVALIVTIAVNALEGSDGYTWGVDLVSVASGIIVGIGEMVPDPIDEFSLYAIGFTGSLFSDIFAAIKVNYDMNNGETTRFISLGGAGRAGPARVAR